MQDLHCYLKRSLSFDFVRWLKVTVRLFCMVFISILYVFLQSQFVCNLFQSRTVQRIMLFNAVSQHRIKHIMLKLYLIPYGAVTVTVLLPVVFIFTDTFIFLDYCSY